MTLPAALAAYAAANPGDVIRAGATLAGAAALTAEGVNAYNRTTALARGLTQSITFPYDLLNGERSAHINLAFKRYVRPSIRVSPRLEFQSGIKLPIPANLTDTYQVSYDNAQMGSIVGAAVESFGGNAPTGLQDVINRLNPVGATGVAALAGVGGALIQQNRNMYAGASAVTGLAVNPFMTVNFKTPEFKTHSFSWKLVPRNSQESEDIRTIIKMIRYHMLPSVSGTAVLFGYPEIVDIRLFPQSEFLYEFKPCVIKDFSANFAPNGPSFYRNGHPTAVEIKISLQEIELWTKEKVDQSVSIPEATSGRRVGGT